MKLPNFAMAIVALLMSIFVWLYVEKQQALITTETIRVDVRRIYSGDPEAESPFEVSKLPETAFIILRGTSDQLERFNIKYGLVKNNQTYFTQDIRTNSSVLRLFAEVDLSRLSMDQDSIRPERWQNADLSAMKISVEMPDLPIIVEEKARKSVPVEVNAINVSDRYQYDPEKSVISPEAVFITGPRTLVSTVAKLVGTIDFTDFKPGSTREVTQLQAQTATGEVVDGVNIDENSISITPNLGPYMPKQSVVVTPVFEGRPAVGYRIYDFSITPNPVQVTGPEANKLDSIMTRAIRINGITTTVTRRKVELIVPKGVNKISQTTVDVEIRVEKIPVLENPNPTPPVTGPPGTTGTNATTGTPPNG